MKLAEEQAAIDQEHAEKRWLAWAGDVLKNGATKTHVFIKKHEAPGEAQDQGQGPASVVPRRTGRPPGLS